MSGPKRREIGHGRLARRGIGAVLPDLENFPYTIPRRVGNHGEQRLKFPWPAYAGRPSP